MRGGSEKDASCVRLTPHPDSARKIGGPSEDINFSGDRIGYREDDSAPTNEEDCGAPDADCRTVRKEVLHPEGPAIVGG